MMNFITRWNIYFPHFLFYNTDTTKEINKRNKKIKEKLFIFNKKVDAFDCEIKNKKRKLFKKRRLTLCISERKKLKDHYVGAW